MKSRIMAAGMSLMIILALTGCGSGAGQQATSKAASVSTVAQVQSTQAQSQQQEKDMFTKFEEALTAAGVKYQKVTMGAELVGAEQGIKFKIDNGTVEIYRFDTGKDEYKTAEKTQSLKMEGFGAFQATVKNGAAMIINGLDEKQYKAIFDGVVK